MNRRSSLKLIMVMTLAIVAGVEGAKKKKNKKKKGGGKKNSQVSKKISGEIVLVKENITNLYKIVSGSTVYSFARSAEDKIKGHVGQNVTVYGRVLDERIMTIELVTVVK